MCVGFGFSNVTFRPSRVFHFRIFSYPSVDTDEQSIATGSCPHFYQTFKMLWQIFRADNVFVRFWGLFRYFTSSYYSRPTRCEKTVIVPSALLTKFAKKLHMKLLASYIIITKLSTKTHLLWRGRVSFEYQGLFKTRPHRSYCFLSMFKLRCKRHYRNLTTYSWCLSLIHIWRCRRRG